MSHGQMQEMKGRAKEAVGALRDDDDQRAEGRRAQREGLLKQAGDKLVDAANDVAKAVRSR